MKFAVACVIAGVLLGGAAFAEKPTPLPPEDVFTATPRVLFQDFALSTCLGQAFPSVLGQANAAARGYVEYGSAPSNAYAEVADLTHQFLKRDYLSESGADLTMMKCIDFMHSKEIDAVMTRYIPGDKK